MNKSNRNYSDSVKLERWIILTVFTTVANLQRCNSTGAILGLRVKDVIVRGGCWIVGGTFN